MDGDREGQSQGCGEHARPPSKGFEFLGGALLAQGCDEQPTLRAFRMDLVLGEDWISNTSKSTSFLCLVFFSLRWGWGYLLELKACRRGEGERRCFGSPGVQRDGQETGGELGSLDIFK